MTKVTATELKQHLQCSATRCSCRGDRSTMTHCPSHDDKTPSLSIKQDSSGGLLHCFAGGSYEQIIGALNIKSHQLGGAYVQRY